MADTKVAFTAVADQGGLIGPFSAERTLVFNTIIYNKGDGIFTAPVAGAYYFTFSYHSAEKNPSGLKLMKSGSLMVQASDTSATGITDNAGNSAVLYLQQGEEVCVRLPECCSVWGTDKATTFSGFLID